MAEFKGNERLRAERNVDNIVEVLVRLLADMTTAQAAAWGLRAYIII